MERWSDLATPPRLGWREVTDVLLAVALGTFAGLAGISTTSNEYPNPGPVTAALMAAAGLILIWRRPRPQLSFVGAMGFMTVVSLLYGPYQAGTSVLIGLVACYSATAWGVTLPVFAAVVVAYAAINDHGPMPGAIGGFLFVVVALGLAGAGGYLTRRLRELTAANVALRELVELEASANARAAVDAERSRVARELHDILSHSLGIVVLQTRAADHAWTADPDQARVALRAACSTANEAIDQLRTLLAAVHEDASADRAPVPTISDLNELATRTTAAGFRIDLDVVGQPRPIAAAVQASVYRVAQEGIANAMKHSGGQAAHIRLTYEPHSLIIAVTDHGGSAPEPRAGSRLGLLGVRERAAVFGARVESGPRDDGGWCLKVAFPA